MIVTYPGTGTIHIEEKHASDRGSCTTNGKGRMNDGQSRGNVGLGLTDGVVAARASTTQARAARSEDAAGQRGARGQTATAARLHIYTCTLG